MIQRYERIIYQNICMPTIILLTKKLKKKISQFIFMFKGLRRREQHIKFINVTFFSVEKKVHNELLKSNEETR